MAQISLYLPEDRMEKLRKRAEGQNLSISAYVSKIIDDDENNTWPDWFFDLAGSVDDETFVRPEQPSFDLDIPRMPL